MIIHEDIAFRISILLNHIYFGMSFEYRQPKPIYKPTLKA